MKQKTLLFLISYLLVFIRLFSQDHDYQHPLVGDWKQISSVENIDIHANADNKQVKFLRVFEDSTYQLAIFDPEEFENYQDFLYYERGYWSPICSRSNIVLTKLVERQRTLTNENKKKEHVSDITAQLTNSSTLQLILPDSSVELYSLLQKDDSVGRYNPTSDSLFNEVRSLFYDDDPSNDLDKYYSGYEDLFNYYLVNIKNPKKKVKLDGSSFNFTMLDYNYSNQKEKVVIEGKFFGLSGSEICIDASRLEKTTELDFDEKIGGRTKLVTEYDWGSGYSDPHIEKVDIKNIDFLKYSNKSSQKIREINMNVLYISGFLVFYLAPLVSMNYKTGKINPDKYSNIAGIGLAGAAITVPFLIIFKNKHYRLITTKCTDYSADTWYIRKERNENYR
jgi:hypothetical protein